MINTLNYNPCIVGGMMMVVVVVVGLQKETLT